MSHTDEQMEQEIQDKGLEAPRVTLDQIKEMMKRVQYIFDQPEFTTSTFAHAFLDGDFYLATGHTACVSKENFDVSLGIKYAQEAAAQKAQDKLWELEGYNLYRNPMKSCEGSKHCSSNINFSIASEFLWESIPTQQVLKYVGPVAFAYVWAVTSDQQDYWTCTISLHAAPEPVPEITANGITEEVAFAAAIRTLKEIVYKNEWVLG